MPFVWVSRTQTFANSLALSTSAKNRWFQLSGAWLRAPEPARSGYLRADTMVGASMPSMPLVRIDLLEGWSEGERSAIADATHAAMVETLNVPERDRFQIITEHPPGHFSFNRSYLEVDRSDRFVLVTVTLSAGRQTQAKQAFYAQLCERLVAAVGLREQDLAVTLVENQREDWSFGRGQASYLVLPPEQWR